MSVKLSREDARRLKLDAPPRANKYHAVRAQYNGRWYDSMAEANHASYLDAEKSINSPNYVLWWVPQVRFDLGPARISYKVDFLVVRRNMTIEVHEVKGRRTERFRIIVKLWRQHGPCTLKIFHKGNLEETIIPETRKP